MQRNTGGSVLRPALMLASKVEARGLECQETLVRGWCVGGLDRQHMNNPFIFVLTHTVAAGRSGTAHDALCVEVLKTSAGLGLSLDGGKSSMSGDGPLVIKRVYKGNILESHRLLPAHFPYVSQ